MKKLLVQRIQFWSMMAVLFYTCQVSAQTNPMAVLHPQATLHGFLELRSEGGLVVAAGEVTQVVHGDVITSRTLFRFRDGSVDDETTVFSQRRTLQLISDHRVQKGSFFPHPMDVLVDARSGHVTVRTTGKNGKEEVKTDHLDLPPDLANGLVPIVIENMKAGAPVTTVSMVVATPKPLLVKLAISPAGEDNCSIVGVTRKATHYEIKVELGGVIGVVAPLIGKAPPNIQIWAIGGDAPTFIRERGPLYSEGPMMTIQLASPVWAASAKAGK